MAEKPKVPHLISFASEIQAIAQMGLVYSDDHYNLERYKQLKKIALDMMALSGAEKEPEWDAFFFEKPGYPTPKVDVRALILKDNQVLLVREVQDGNWSLPGGWADVNQTAAESVVKEVLEETGLTGKAVRLLALWDSARHDHPPHWPYIYKCVFECEILSGELAPNHEIMDVGYFPLDKLPQLSICRITEKQIQTLVKQQQQPDAATLFD